MAKIFYTGNKEEKLLSKIESSKERQRIEQEIVNEIEGKILEIPELLQQKLLFLWDDKWNPSVLGIAASKLSKKYYCPVILLSTAQGNAVGSGRSINNINIFKALQKNHSLLVKFGGHAMACGLTVATKNLNALHEKLNQYLDKSCSEQDFKRTKFIDAVLDIEDINYSLAKEIDQLRPFGIANPEPIFVCKNIRVKHSYLIAGRHRKMVLENVDSSNSHQVEAFHFNVDDPDNLPDFYPQIAFKLKIDKFKKNSAQIIIEQL